MEAIRCYKLASDFGVQLRRELWSFLSVIGHAPAAAAVAYAHEQGQAVGKDLSQAARWYRKGADGGDLKCLVKYVRKPIRHTNGLDWRNSTKRAKE